MFAFIFMLRHKASNSLLTHQNLHIYDNAVKKLRISIRKQVLVVCFLFLSFLFVCLVIYFHIVFFSRPPKSV